MKLSSKKISRGIISTLALMNCISVLSQEPVKVAYLNKPRREYHVQNNNGLYAQEEIKLREEVPPVQQKTPILEFLKRADISSPSEKFEEVLSERGEREFRNKFRVPASELNRKFTFLNAPKNEIYRNELEYRNHLASSALTTVLKETGRSLAKEIFQVGGFFGEVIEGRFDTYSISSPFKTEEGPPGIVYNPESKRHMTLRIWSDDPYISYKTHFGMQSQFNIRADRGGAEASFVKKNVILNNLDLVASTRLNDYDPQKAYFYGGFNYPINEKSFLQIGFKASQMLDSENRRRDNRQNNILFFVGYSSSL